MLFAWALVAPAATALAAVSDQVTPEGMAQVTALLREKDSRTPAQRKIDSNLLYEIRMKRGESIASGAATLQTGLAVDVDGSIAVELRATVTDALLKEIASLNGAVFNVSTPYHTVAARLPIDAIEAVAARPEVVFILPHFPANTWQGAPAPRPAQAITDVARPSFAERAQRVRDFLEDALADPLPQVGSRNSEGDTTHQANIARSANGPNGSGIKIGVLSDGVVSLALSQALGDLGPVTVLPGQTGGGDEGTAMLEIVHDLAPAAQLYFATANPTIAQFAQNVRDLRAAGCDIIIDDIYYFVETPFQDGQSPSVVSNTNGGAVIEAVNDVVAAGAMYFASAGNRGNLDDVTSSCYQGDWVDGGTVPGAAGGNVHNFGGGAQSDLILNGTGQPINLYWADPLGGSANDYDLFVFDTTLTTVVSASTNIQNGSQDPFEQAVGSDTNNRVVVLKKTAAAARFFYITINARAAGSLATATEGAIKGHGIAAGAFSVGATPAMAPEGPFPGPFTTASVTETFSSDGPRRIFFTANGTAITPGNFTSTGGLLRQKPDITAADRVSVTGVGGFGTTFVGTSAAAPHAGAIAALLKSGLPSATNAQIRTALISTALDIEGAGVDRDAGAGIVMPIPAMAALGIPAQAEINPGTFTLAELAGASDGDGNVEKGETGTLLIALVNGGPGAATGVSATLTTSTTGVTVLPSPTRPYPNIAGGGGSATNASAYQFQLGAAYTCLAPVDFVLTVSYNDGSARSRAFPFQLTFAAGFEVTTTLDATAPPPSPGYTAVTGLQNQRILQTGIGGACGVFKPFPGANSGSIPYDAYTFVATNTGCHTVTLVAGPAGANFNFAAVYSGSFDPLNPLAGYITDAGSSPVNGGQVSFGFNATAGQTYIVVVSEVPGSGSSTQPYTVKVNGPSPTTCDYSAASADLSITKTDGVSTAVPGGSVTYTITASNSGPSGVTGATVADTFPAALTATWTCVGAGGGTCTGAGAGNLNDTVNLPVGGSVTYTVNAAIIASATGTLSNTATVAPPGGVNDPVPGNNSATDTDTLTPQANLAITKTDGVTTATPGGSVTYTITASNAGPSNATGATVADTFPAILTATWTCVGAGGGTCTAAGAGNINNVVNLPAGGSVTYTATATINAAATGTVSNTATVAAPGGVTDPTPGNNSATDTDTLVAATNADLSITKSDGVTFYYPGQALNYTMAVANGGPAGVTGATMADTLPTDLSDASWTCAASPGSACAAPSGTGNINTTLNLLSGGTATFTLTATASPTATGSIVNTASVATPGGVTDPVPGNNSATDTDARKGGSYHTVTPCRILDTRDPAGPYGAPSLTSTTRPFIIAGQCGVPVNATAVAINLTVTNGTTGGFVVASPTGGALPPVSTINYGASQTRANNAVVSLGSGGQLSLTASGTVDAILDVAGYFVE